MEPSSDTSQTSRRPGIIRPNVHWAFCLALTLFYLSLTPGTIEGAGYNHENLVAADQLGVNVKTNGVFLLPSLCFLIYCYFTRNPGQKPGALRASLPKLSVLLTVIALIYTLNHYTSAKHWAGVEVGASAPFFEWLADNPLLMLFHAFSCFGSINKSLLIFAPVTALSLISVKRAYSKHPRIVIFSLLTLFGLLGGFSLLYMWAEETWGPRYLHSAIAPLILCLAGAVSDKPFRWRREITLLAVMVLGVAASFLGSFFYYGKLHDAATRSLHSTLEEIQHDPTLNHLRFNLALLKVWGRERLGQPDRPEPWPPSRHWWFSRPPDAPPEKTVELCDYADPQPLLANEWKESSPIPRPVHRLLRLVCFVCLVTSIGLFAVIARLVTTRAVDGSLNDQSS
ncbi:MAG: hypothetical protein L0Y75_03795 [Acidobacteria bacterium]|nr:hypothetical protein [Acidobacteriota bacterium]